MNCYGSCCQGSMRNFLTREEKVELLREYKKDLDREAQGVAERIAQLEKD